MVKKKKLIQRLNKNIFLTPLADIFACFKQKTKQNLDNLFPENKTKCNFTFRKYTLIPEFVLPRNNIKGIVHFEIKMWYLSAHPKDIQDVGVFFSSVDPILMFLGQTVLVCQSYNDRYRSLSL